jgi:hypothetical protein
MGRICRRDVRRSKLFHRYMRSQYPRESCHHHRCTVNHHPLPNCKRPTRHSRYHHDGHCPRSDCHSIQCYHLASYKHQVRRNRDSPDPGHRHLLHPDSDSSRRRLHLRHDQRCHRSSGILHHEHRHCYTSHRRIDRCITSRYHQCRSGSSTHHHSHPDRKPCKQWHNAG